jgi:hypothetical protein
LADKCQQDKDVGCHRSQNYFLGSLEDVRHSPRPLVGDVQWVQVAGASELDDGCLFEQESGYELVPVARERSRSICYPGEEQSRTFLPLLLQVAPGAFHVQKAVHLEN